MSVKNSHFQNLKSSFTSPLWYNAFPMERLNYTILLKTSTAQRVYLLSALNFCKELLHAAHSIHCLFLQNEAVYLSSNTTVCLEDEISIQQQWQYFIKENTLSTLVCTNSALRRGIIDQHFAEIYRKQITLAPMFKLAPLGALFSAIEISDRFIQL